MDLQMGPFEFFIYFSILLVFSNFSISPVNSIPAFISICSLVSRQNYISFAYLAKYYTPKFTPTYYSILFSHRSPG